MFMSLFVIYGFDTASTLAEETKNPGAAMSKTISGHCVTQATPKPLQAQGLFVAEVDDRHHADDDGDRELAVQLRHEHEGIEQLRLAASLRPAGQPAEGHPPKWLQSRRAVPG